MYGGFLFIIIVSPVWSYSSAHYYKKNIVRFRSSMEVHSMYERHSYAAVGLNDVPKIGKVRCFTVDNLD